MKRILTFIWLKVVEIAGFIFIPYYVGLLMIPNRIFNFPMRDYGVADIWVAGLVTILAPSAVLMGVAGIVAINWGWAGKIAKKMDKQGDR